MNPEIKAKWLAALRSGEYKQGQGTLRCGDSFCCLGVLSDLHAKETGVGRWKMVGGDEDSIQYEYIPTKEALWGDMDLPPVDVRDWAGLDGCNPTVAVEDDGEQVFTDIAELNDGGLSFAVIADLIEQRL